MNSIREIDVYKEGVRKEAEELALKKFPKKVFQLEELLKDKRFQLGSYTEDIDINIPVPECQHSHSNGQSPDGQSSSKRPKLSVQSCGKSRIDGKDSRKDMRGKKPVLYPSGVVQTNKYLEELVSVVKPHLVELSDDSLSLKIGVSLLIPRIEDGNNFGVEIQHEVIETAGVVEDDTNQRLNAINTYFEARAELVSKLAKNPLNEDYRLSIKERDQMFHSFLCISLTLIRNYYTNLHDLVLKNIQKIQKPKSETNEEMLY